MLSDSHALWAVIDDLVVAPLVEGHLAALTGETLDKALEWTKDWNLFSKTPNKVFIHGTKHWLEERLQVHKYIFSSSI